MHTTDNFHAVRRELYTRYGHRADLQMIDTILDETIAEHTATARISDFLPILIQREAAERVEHHLWMQGEFGRPRPRILFSGRDNSARAVLAAALARDISGNGVVVTVAPGHPENRDDLLLEWVMDERGLRTDGTCHDLPTGDAARTVDTADLVVYLDAHEPVDLPGRRHLHWDIGSTDGMDLPAARAFADRLEEQVRGLLAELGVPERLRETAHL